MVYLLGEPVLFGLRRPATQECTPIYDAMVDEGWTYPGRVALADTPATLPPDAPTATLAAIEPDRVPA